MCIPARWGTSKLPMRWRKPFALSLRKLQFVKAAPQKRVWLRDDSSDRIGAGSDFTDNFTSTGSPGNRPCPIVRGGHVAFGDFPAVSVDQSTSGNCLDVRGRSGGVAAPVHVAEPQEKLDGILGFLEWGLAAAFHRPGHHPVLFPRPQDCH